MVQGDGITDYEQQQNPQAQPAAQQQQGGMMNRMKQGMANRYRGGQNSQQGGLASTIARGMGYGQNGPGVSGPPGQSAAQGGNAGWRGDGQNVPGNQPGGQNGSYGQYGQNPQMQPPPSPPSGQPTFGGQFGNNIAQGQKPVAALVNAAISRYRGPQQQPQPAGAMPSANQPAGAMPSANQPAPADTPTAGAASSPPQSQAMSGEGDMPAMKDGGIVNKPTVAMLGEKGPEAVIPLSGQNPNAKLSPGMFSKTRYRRPTGPSSVHGPIRPLEPLAPSKVMR